MQKVFESEFVTVFYNESKSQLETHWTPKTKGLTSSLFKEHVKRYADLVKTYSIKTVFIDSRKYDHIVSDELGKWHDEEIVPKYIEYGLKKMGFLQPEEAFAQLGHQFVFDEEKARTGLLVQFFDDEANARAWLDSVE